jgi:hypothetical protein
MISCRDTTNHDGKSTTLSPPKVPPDVSSPRSLRCGRPPADLGRFHRRGPLPTGFCGERARRSLDLVPRYRLRTAPDIEATARRLGGTHGSRVHLCMAHGNLRQACLWTSWLGVHSMVLMASLLARTPSATGPETSRLPERHHLPPIDGLSTSPPASRAATTPDGPVRLPAIAEGHSRCISLILIRV